MRLTRIADHTARVLLVGALTAAFIPVSATATLVRGAQRVSVTSAGGEGSGQSDFPDISGDGGFVAFQSTAPDLVPNDSNGAVDVFVYETATGLTKRVSLDGSDHQLGGESKSPSINGDGSLVAFQSEADVPGTGDTTAVWDIFLRDIGAGSIELVSLSSAQEPGNYQSRDPAISSNGNRVAFVSAATNLAGTDSGDHDDVYVRDLYTTTTRRVSETGAGAEGTGESAAPSISADGRYVAFQSTAPNLVPNDTNTALDVFVYDWNADSIELVSVNSEGEQGNMRSLKPSISGDGRFVAFHSDATNLVPGDGNGSTDVFVRDRQTGTTVRVSVSSSGTEGDGRSEFASISADGTRVAFYSSATNLVGGDNNGKEDVFLHDLSTGATDRVSSAAGGYPADGHSRNPALDATGGAIVFDSYASDIVAADTNDDSDVFLAATGPRSYVRIAGATRYDTAVEASKRAHAAGSVDTVVIATGRNWPDALGGSALAGVVGGPLLLTDTSTLPAAVASEIDRLGASKAYILGGTGAVGTGVHSALAAKLGASGVVRLSGTDRYGTARAVASEVISLQGAAYDGTAVVATGANYPDALAGSPLASSRGWPILLAHPSAGLVYRPAEVSEALILGGTGAVSASVESALKSALGAGAVVRKGGADRYATAALVADYGVATGSAWDNVGLATGQNFPDALSGGAMLGRFDSVLLLTRTDTLLPAASAPLSSNADAISTVHIIGGTGAVSSAVESSLKATVGE